MRRYLNARTCKYAFKYALAASLIGWVYAYLDWTRPMPNLPRIKIDLGRLNP